MPLVGGLGEVKPADEIISQVLTKLKTEIKQKIEGLSTEIELEPVSYKTQLVAGRNFFAKVKLAENHFIHIRIYRDLQGNVSLHSVTGRKTEIDEIEYF